MNTKSSKPHSVSAASKQAVVLFADLVGSARLSDVLLPSKYEEIVASFQKTAVDLAEETQRKCKKRAICDIDIRGDQLVFIGVVKQFKSTPDVAKEILELAIKLSIRWFFSQTNRERIRAGAAPFEVGMGIHTGAVWFGPHWRIARGGQRFAKFSTPEGFSVNFAKRVESLSRLGNSSRIAMSQSFISLCKAAGFPLFLSEPLSGESKGFDSPEPVYELLGQEIFPHKASDDETSRLLDDLKQIQMAFRRDPERIRWILEMALGARFWKGYGNGKRRLWREGRQSALDAAKIVQEPARFYFDAGRFSHKLGWGHKSACSKRDLLAAIDYHHMALADPQMQWAASDLAVVHARFGDVGWKHQPREEEALHHLNRAKKVSDRLVEEFPDHYYSYFIRSIVSSQLAQHLQPSTKRSRLIELATSDLRTMKLLNREPKYLPFLARVELELANENIPGAERELTLAEKLLRGEDPAVHESSFLQKGVVVPGFRPPPLTSFKGRFEILKDKIAAAKALVKGSSRGR